MTEPAARILPRHGGDLDFATAAYGTPAGGWLDLSTGINPHPYPVSAIDTASLAALPQERMLRDLVAAAGAAYSVPMGVPLIATPGSEIALRLLPLVAPDGRVAIVSPTYGGHAEAWRNAGRAVVIAPALAEVPSDAAVVVVGNPNNPDGRLTSPDELAEIARGLARYGGLLIVDEAFADIAPHASLAGHLDGIAAVVLRSFGKFFGLPGLRLGFAAGMPPILTRLAALLGDWPVAAPAIAVGTAALRDNGWQRQARERLGEEAARLRSLLARHGCAVVGGTDLFALVEVGDAGALHRRLAKAGVWTRAFAERPHWLRLGLPPDDPGFARLERALTAH